MCINRSAHSSNFRFTDLSVACRASLAYDLPPISERFLLDLWQLKFSGQSVLHSILVLGLRDSFHGLPGVLELPLAPLRPLSIE